MRVKEKNSDMYMTLKELQFFQECIVLPQIILRGKREITGLSQNQKPTHFQII